MAESDKPVKSDGFGGFLGIIVFLAGIALLFYAFQTAAGILAPAPAQAMGLDNGQPADLMKTGQNFIGLLQQVVVLLVMCTVGAIVATRGVKMYGASRGKE